MAKRQLLLFFVFITVQCASQADTTLWVRAFPITNYITKLNDSVSVVQVYLPDGPVLKDKQLGLLRGVYMTDHADTIMIGAGRCNLIKGTYYYFTINNSKSGKQPKENDLLYTLVQKPQGYKSQFLRLATHFIELQNVYENSFYDPYTILQEWKLDYEQKAMDSIVQDIRFTGDYFKKNDDSQDKLIASGIYKGKKIFTVMTACTTADVEKFFDYMIARPRLYAGKKWKVSEVFATWLGAGAPLVIKEK